MVSRVLLLGTIFLWMAPTATLGFWGFSMTGTELADEVGTA